MFTALALIATIDYCRKDGTRRLWAAIIYYVLALSSKESGYAFPVLAAICVPLSNVAKEKSDRPLCARRTLRLAIGIFVTTALMLAMRLAILGGVGGYVDINRGRSVHLSISVAAIRAILTKALPDSLLSVNLIEQIPPIILIAICAFALLLSISALAGASTTRKEAWLLVCAIASTLPVVAILGWLDSSARNVRYLYLPSLFMMMLVAAALSNARWSTALLASFAFLNLSCGTYNMWVYQSTYKGAESLAKVVAKDYADLGKPTQIAVFAMPREYNGVYFSQFEFQYRVQQLLPGVAMDFNSATECGPRLCYVWLPSDRTLSRLQSHP
jgi:uncharacterized membrane protein